MTRFLFFLATTVALFSASLVEAASTGKYFDRAVIVIFENTDYLNALKQPFFKQLANQGANFSNFMALIHPSQGNYIGLTSGSLYGVNNDGNTDLNVRNIVDLLEAKGLTWKVYAEDYPGNCFTGATSQGYVRKHNPFISYLNIQRNPTRCANIVNASQFDQDAAQGTLPNYVFYVPNIRNDAHDTGIAYADKWYSQKFSPYLANDNFMKNTVLITTFDESGGGSKNQIYTSIVGPAVNAGNVSTSVNIYSLLALIEENWNLGNLGQGDVNAPTIPNIWR